MRKTQLLTTAAVMSVALLSAPAMAEPLPLGWFGSVEGGFSFFSGGDAVYAIDRSAYPAFSTEEAGPGNGGYGRVGFGYRFNNSWDFGVFVSGLRSSSGTDTTTAYGPEVPPDSRPPLSAGGPVVYEPDAYEYSTARGEADLSSFMMDFEAGYDVGIGGDATMRLFGGLRAGYITQETSMDFGYSIADLSPTNETLHVERRSSFVGAGPRLGVQGDFGLGGGFSLFGGLSGAVLFGSLSVDSDSAAYGYTSSQRSSDTRFVYQAGGELGVGYSLADAGILASVQLGFRAEWTWNGVDGSAGPNVVDPPVQNATFGNDSEDFGAYGPFLRLNFKF